VLFGYGTSRSAARSAAQEAARSIPLPWVVVKQRITFRPLSADEASEIAEMLATNW
jgi:hypothetical protein